MTQLAKCPTLLFFFKIYFIFLKDGDWADGKGERILSGFHTQCGTHLKKKKRNVFDKPY